LRVWRARRRVLTCQLQGAAGLQFVNLLRLACGSISLNGPQELTADADLTSILDSYRSDQRPQALVRLGDDGVCRIIAASKIMLQAVGASDDTGLLAWLEGKGGPGLLTRHAESREVLTHDLGGGQSLVFSIREQSPGVFQIRGSKVGPAEVSNSLTAGIIANIVNEETGILFLDPQNRVLAINDTFYRFFPKAEGYPQIGESYEALLRDSFRRGYLPTSTGREEKFIQGTLDHFAGESPKPLMVLTSNGRWANTSRLRFSNGAVAILMIDVTEREIEIDQYKTFVRNTRNMIYCRVEAD